MIKVKKDYCKGCGYCTLVCPTGSIKMPEELDEEGKRVPIVVDEDTCKKCHLCELSCPDFAISVEEE
jgi:2-oxoglutarate ferredoxin oxidoreductase subunit delta